MLSRSPGGLAGAIFALCGALVACTVSNPTYQGEDASSDLLPGGDLPPGGETGPHRDRGGDFLPVSDLRPWPDSAPWQCTGNGQCNDGKSCTIDLCNDQKICENQLKAQSCLIYNVCYEAGQQNPLDDCEACDPGQSQTSWTVRGNGASCTTDNLSCTTDTCQAGTCTHLLTADSCLIDGKCYASGDLAPQNTCQSCNPDGTGGSTGWTPRLDSSPCASDGLSCTNDHCQKGTCVHQVTTGCLVGGTCYGEGQENPGDPCRECAGAVSQTSFTFIAGKPCASSFGLGAICAQNKCSSWVESTFEPTPPSPFPLLTSALNAAGPISPAGSIWAVGEYLLANGTKGGTILPLGSVAPVPVLTTAPLQALHYRLAVGDAGQAWYHDGNKWVEDTALELELGGMDRLGVWGAPIGFGESFFLSGRYNGVTPGVTRCFRTGSSSSCQEHSGFEWNALLGPIHGALTATGALDGLWTIPVEVPGDEDIYYLGSSTTAWTRSPPEGCLEMSGTPCYATPGDYRHLHGVERQEIWAVGTSGLIMRWSGSGWSKVTVSATSTTHLNAVYLAAPDNLVLIAGHQNQSGGRRVVTFAYNITLSRWFGPTTLISPTSGNVSDEIRDIGGQGYTNLWMVGQRLAGSPARLRGWILQLQ